MSNVNLCLLSSLFPRRLTEGIEKEAFNERPMLAIATLASNIALRAAEFWERGEIKKFDPNPGDGACQIRGYLLYLFSYDRALREEMIGLGKQAKKIEKVVKERKQKVTSKEATLSSGAFFRQQFGEVMVSRKLEFILQCYLLAVTRVPYQRLENGIVVTKSDANYLLKLSKNITKIVSIEECRKIVEVAQFNLSTNSVELLRMEAVKLASAEKKQILFMLSPEMTRIYTPDAGKYEPKTFGCLFYEYKAILFRLREERSLVCFKSIVPSDRVPFRILLRPQKAGGEFSVIPKEDVDPQSPMVVFEGVVNARYGQESFSQKIAEIGFTELILATAAIESPYERGSELSAVTDEAARAEITRYRRFAETIECQKEAVDPLLILDHVYCNLLRAEMR